MNKIIKKIFLLSIVCYSCDSNSPTNTIVNDILKVVNKKPNIPVLINPVKNGASTDTTLTFQWRCTDPDGDNLVYDFYLDESINPKIYIGSLKTTSYKVKSFDFNKKYYWKICARDDSSSSCSEIVSFTTKIDSSIFNKQLFGLWKDTLEYCVGGDSSYQKLDFLQLYLSKDGWNFIIDSYTINNYTLTPMNASNLFLRNFGGKWFAGSDSLFLPCSLTYWRDKDTSYHKDVNFIRDFKYKKEGNELWLWTSSYSKSTLKMKQEY